MGRSGSLTFADNMDELCDYLEGAVGSDPVRMEDFRAGER